MTKRKARTITRRLRPAGGPIRALCKVPTPVGREPVHLAARPPRSWTGTRSSRASAASSSSAADRSGCARSGSTRSSSPGGGGAEHDHPGWRQEEVDLVLRGAGTMVVGGEKVELGPGPDVFVAPRSTRQPIAGPQGLSRVVVGAPPQDGWEPGV